MRCQHSRRLAQILSATFLCALVIYFCVRELLPLGFRKHRFGSYEEDLFHPVSRENIFGMHGSNPPPDSAAVTPVRPAPPSLRQDSIRRPSTAQILKHDEVVLILKTGSSTPSDRLRAQLETFASSKYVRAPINTIVISDAPEVLQVGDLTWQVLDVIDDLANITSVATSDKFKIYQAQKERIKAGEATQTHDPPGSNNGGWTLDALKFLPGYSRAAKLFPNAKWFIGLDDDNYLFWDSLLQFLALQDHTQKLYIGSPSWIVANQIKFIHGGSVTISSQAAVKARFIDNVAGLEQFHEAATTLCCGDGILAMAYADLHIMPNDLYRDFFNGEPMENTRVSQSQFCKPLLGLHHLSGDNIRAIDHQWDIKRVHDRHDKNAITTWGNYLKNMVRPMDMASGQRKEWDYAFIEDNKDKISVMWRDEKSADICRSTCQQSPETCLSWTFVIETEECWLSPMATVGQSASSRISGINLDRVRDLQRACETQDWRREVLRKAAIQST